MSTSLVLAASPRATEAEYAIVDWQYATACQLITDVAEEIGTDRMRDVFRVLWTDEGAYPGQTDAIKGFVPTWRGWLDAVARVRSDGA